MNTCLELGTHFLDSLLNHGIFILFLFYFTWSLSKFAVLKHFWSTVLIKNLPVPFC